MNRIKNGMLLLVFGSLWGIIEVFGGEAFFRNGVPFASVWLTGWALLMLGIARGLLDRAGSSTVVGGTAALFKLAYAAPYYCHLLGIFYIGLVFDIAASAWLKNERRSLWRSLSTGVVTAYAGYTLFALTITYVARYGPWVAGGTAKVLNHILSGGSLAALAALVLVPVGLRIGAGGEAAARQNPRWTTAGALVLLVLLWTIGRFIS